MSGAPVPGWEPRPRPEPVTRTGRYVEVRPLTSAHYADLHAATCGPGDDDLWTYRPIPRPETLPGLWMHLAGQLEDPAWVSFALVPREGERAGRATGIASYLRIEEAHGQVEVAGVLLGRALQRTRAATEAIHLLMRYAFDDLGYRRFEWKCDSRNEASRRAALRLGFVEEGRFRNHMVVQGRNRDTDWFSVTDAEWPAVRAAHERWLDPANFGADGHQLSSLRA
ncbi:GNAT family N-acetyltransferase [Nocardioides sp. LML1-1-1.1]|uniref:GNAT family N-acetyltransferase n=1 Tax=Nocardioides sp. LML1-1-1.1 TaxID=3135248 RepID=UPI003415D3ED